MYAGIGCLFLLFFSLLFIGVELLRSVFQILAAAFGFKKPSWNQTSGQQQTRRPEEKEPARQQEKIFKKDEGKYIDFEEV